MSNRFWHIIDAQISDWMNKLYYIYITKKLHEFLWLIPNQYKVPCPISKDHLLYSGVKDFSHITVKSINLFIESSQEQGFHKNNNNNIWHLLRAYEKSSILIRLFYLILIIMI